MFHIKDVEIDGFWGKHSIKTKFHDDVNIFIGKNGTGKTTFINLLHGVLQVDIPILIANEFSNIIIRLSDARKTRTIKVKRQAGETSYDLLTFSVGTRTFKLQVYERDLDLRRMRLRPTRLVEQIDALKQQILELVSVSSLSVHRTPYVERYDEEFPRRPASVRKAPIDRRLDALMQQLTSYQLNLATSAREISSRFEKNVLASMLYDPKFDTWDVKEVSPADLGKQKHELLKAYRELGMLDDTIQAKINTHIDKLSITIKHFKSNKLSIEDLMPLPLLRRTHHIVELTKETEEQKQRLYHPIKQFVEEILGFVEDKTFSFSSGGELLIVKGNKPISIAQLSSGEKQLLILLTETVLQRNLPFIFLAR